MFDDYIKKYTTEEIEELLLKFIEKKGSIITDADVQDFIESIE